MVQGKMSDFIVAVGLVLVIEGLLYAAFPQAAKRMATHALATPDGSLRTAGVVAAILGVLLVWAMRG
jgi:uncharacterized protein